MNTSRRVKRAAERVGFRLFVGLVRSLPPDAAARAAGATGRLVFALGIRRRVAVENVLERLDPPGGRPEAERIARASYEVAGRTFASLLRADLLDEDAIWRLVRREDIERVRAAAGGGGAVLVSGHFGNWELLVLAIRRTGMKVAAMAADQANPAVDAAVRSVRDRAGVRPLSARSGLREALQLLREGACVATLMDQDARRRGVFVEFLGAPASAHVGPVSMALRTGVPLVPGVLVDDGGRYHFEIGAPWRPESGASEAESLRAGAVHFHRFLEEQVRNHPGNYFWAHRRWKTRPADEAVPLATDERGGP